MPVDFFASDTTDGHTLKLHRGDDIISAGGTPMDARTSRYHDVYAQWQRNPEAFWAEAAADIDWYEKPKKIFDPSAGIYGRWFAGATCNTCYNALDRHVLSGRNDQAALIYDSPVTYTLKTFTYGRMLSEVQLLGAMLRDFG